MEGAAPQPPNTNSMGKSSKEKKTAKGKSNSGTCSSKQDFLKESSPHIPKATPRDDTDSSGDESGEGTKTRPHSQRNKVQPKAAASSKNRICSESDTNGASSEEEGNHSSRDSQVKRTGLGEKQPYPLSSEQDFPPLTSSQDKCSGADGKGTPLQRLLKADRRIFKAVSIIASEAPENEVILAQIDHLINELAKMKTVILEATHEAAGLRGELNATREILNMGEGAGKTMADVVKQRSTGEPDMRRSPTKPKEAILVKSSTHSKDQLVTLIKDNIDPCSLGLRDVEMRPSRDGVLITATSKEAISSLQRELESTEALRPNIEVTKGKKRLPQIKIVGISEDIPDAEIPARIITQNELKCTADDLILSKTWKGREGKTACLEVTKAAHDALKGRTHLNIKWTRCRFFDNTFIPRCKNCAQLGHVEKFCNEAPRCTDCGGAHHYRQCQSTHKSCRACAQELPQANRAHSFLSYDCPAFREAQSRRTQQLIALL